MRRAPAENVCEVHAVMQGSREPPLRRAHKPPTGTAEASPGPYRHTPAHDSAPVQEHAGALIVFPRRLRRDRALAVMGTDGRTERGRGALRATGYGGSDDSRPDATPAGRTGR